VQAGNVRGWFQVKKVCVFCGGEPSSKTKEHVVPQWLIELTGQPNRLFYLGLDLRKCHGLRTFSASNLHFPACQKCNSDFSEFESEAKTVLERILTNSSLDAKEIDILFDWFDKVRTGLWLGMRYLDANYWKVDPHYYIRKRIGVADRMMGIYLCSSGRKDLTFTGIQTPGFSWMPSCFAFRVNHCVFFNVSTDFLISRRIGFPYPRQICITKEGALVLGYMEPAKRRIMKPIIRRNLSPPVMCVYQPVIRKEVLEQFPELYTDGYVRQNMLVREEGKGRILVERGDDVDWLSGTLKILDNKFDYRKESGEELLRQMAIQTLDLQRWLHENHPSLSLFAPAERARTKRLLAGTKEFHGKLIERLRKS